MEEATRAFPQPGVLVRAVCILSFKSYSRVCSQSVLTVEVGGKWEDDKARGVHPRSWSGVCCTGDWQACVLPGKMDKVTCPVLCVTTAGGIGVGTGLFCPLRKILRT